MPGTDTKASGLEPDLTVVIPSGRPLRLPFVLEALETQTLHGAEFEVIVVTDPAVPGPWPEARANVRFLTGSRRRNIAALRNDGWREGNGRLVVFTDDDCRPDRRWLERFREATLGQPRCVLQGTTSPDPDETHLLHGLARSQDIQPPSGWFQTCNIAYPRDALEELGGFDEDFGQLGEDADLGLRAARAGIELREMGDALVWHAVVQRTLSDALAEALRRDTLPQLIARHPGQRRHLYAWAFWKRSHATLLLALAGGLVTRRPSLVVLAAVPYVRGKLDLREIRTPQRLVRAAGALASVAVVDAAEIAATVRGSLRARTLVL